MRTEQCKKIINNYFSDPVLIEEIGNHHLGRHFVYKITEKAEYVMKFYFKEHKWEREISALRLLNDKTYKTPKIIDCGITNEIEWLLYKFVDGETLNDLKLDEESLKKIYKKLGKEIAKVHRDNQYEKFGRLTLTGDFYIVNDTNKDYIQYIYKSTMKNLSLINHDNKELVNRAGKSLENELGILVTNEKGSLCHNDLSDRNILVNAGNFQMLFDFEQSSVSDRYRELSLTKYYLAKSGKSYFNDFLIGYTEEYTIDLETLEQREKVYLLLHGLMVCSWSLEVNKEYYDEGIAILEKYC